MNGLDRLQRAMIEKGVDALLLAGDGATVFAGGHRRIGVHMPGWPMPMIVVPQEGLPHVVTADPDGATNLPEDHVHPLVWNPATTAARLPLWLGAAATGTVGLDVLTPGGLQLVQAALPDAELFDARHLLAEVRFVKTEEELANLRKAADIAAHAARAGLEGGLEGGVERAYEALEGHFPASPPQVRAGSARATVLFESFVGESRQGPGDPAVLNRAIDVIEPGMRAEDLASALPPQVEVIGLGRGYEPPVIRQGWASPPEVLLRPGGVLLVATPLVAVSVVLTETGTELLSLSPEEVCR